VLSKIWRFLRRLGIGGQQTRIDDSSQLIRLGRDEYRYVEGDRSVNVYVEMLTGVPSKLIHSDSIDQWLPPHQDEQINDEERHRISNKIANFLTGKGYSVEIK